MLLQNTASQLCAGRCDLIQILNSPQWLPVLLCVDCRVSAACYEGFKWAGWPRPFRLAHRKLLVIPQRAQAFEVARPRLWKSPRRIKSAKLILFLSILMQVGMALNVLMFVLSMYDQLFCNSGVSVLLFGLLFYSILSDLGCFQLWFIDKLDVIWTLLTELFFCFRVCEINNMPCLCTKSFHGFFMHILIHK